MLLNSARNASLPMKLCAMPISTSSMIRRLRSSCWLAPPLTPIPDTWALAIGERSRYQRYLSIFSDVEYLWSAKGVGYFCIFLHENNIGSITVRVDSDLAPLEWFQLVISNLGISMAPPNSPADGFDAESLVKTNRPKR